MLVAYHYDTPSVRESALPPSAKGSQYARGWRAGGHGRGRSLMTRVINVTQPNERFQPNKQSNTLIEGGWVLV